jgi:hypothetical protein
MLYLLFIIIQISDIFKMVAHFLSGHVKRINFRFGYSVLLVPKLYPLKFFDLYTDFIITIFEVNQNVIRSTLGLKLKHLTYQYQQYNDNPWLTYIHINNISRVGNIQL